MTDWDACYRMGGYDKGDDPHALLVRLQSLIPEGPVIDIAAGSGSDALFLAEKGRFVCGLERSRAALMIARSKSIAIGREIGLVAGDATVIPFKVNCAAAVTVFYFLDRKIMGQIADLLRKGGILIYETFLKRQNMIDRWRNPEHLLDDGELLYWFGALELLFYQEIMTDKAGKKRIIAQYAGRKM
ncbi:MAG: methyltransferase domain-containing protein [Syntrophobacterales bacterium]|jgi:SAM-dependent methyltransferase|nr:methyltransferase domain-containing protein [Syntrophobacterales bacterium]